MWSENNIWYLVLKKIKKIQIIFTVFLKCETCALSDLTTLDRTVLRICSGHYNHILGIMVFTNPILSRWEMNTLQPSLKPVHKLYILKKNIETFLHFKSYNDNNEVVNWWEAELK